MRIFEITDYNRREEDNLNVVLGKHIPKYPEVAKFSNRTGFDFAQVCKLNNGNFFADFGKELTKEFTYVGMLETQLRKRRMTEYTGVGNYRPSSY